MRRKEQARRVGTILLLIGAGALGIMVGVVLFLTNPGLIPIPVPTPPTSTPLPFIEVPTNTPQPTWIVTYEHRFSPDLLTAGNHEYVIGISCPPDLGSGSYSGAFTINEQAALQQNRVYVRPSGVWDSAVGGSQLSAINLEQAVGAAVSLRYNTLDQAERARENCKVSVQLDLSRPVRLDPALPKQEE